MGAVGFKLKDVITKMFRKGDKVPLTQGALFIVPILAMMLSSYALFSLLRDFTTQELNVFLISVMYAVVLGVVGTAPMQILTYLIVGDSRYSEGEAIARGIRVGIIYCVVFSILVSGLLYPYFQNVLDFSLTDFSYFAILLVLYSMVLIFTTAFWATDNYKYPAFVFTSSFLIIFALSYGLYRVNPSFTISGYTGGIAVLLLLLAITLRSAFKKEQGAQKLSRDDSTIWRLVLRNYPVILFQVFYMIAIFLDKIIVWISEGSVIAGPYTRGAFLGLIPMFSIAALAYFTSKVKPFIEDMYGGTFFDIQERIERYKSFYHQGLRAMLMIGIALFILVVVPCFCFIDDFQTVKIAVTTSIGILFFIPIVYNSVVLPIFGKISISTISMLIVCVAESLTILLVVDDVWYASVGFLVGSFVGFLISSFSVKHLFSAFDYNAFRSSIVAGWNA
jgi:uncharacterized membrane protein